MCAIFVNQGLASKQRFESTRQQHHVSEIPDVFTVKTVKCLYVANGSLHVANSLKQTHLIVLDSFSLPVRQPSLDSMVAYRTTQSDTWWDDVVTDDTVRLIHWNLYHIFVIQMKWNFTFISSKATYNKRIQPRGYNQRLARIVRVRIYLKPFYTAPEFCFQNYKIVILGHNWVTRAEDLTHKAVCRLMDNSGVFFVHQLTGRLTRPGSENPQYFFQEDPTQKLQVTEGLMWHLYYTVLWSYECKNKKWKRIHLSEYSVQGHRVLLFAGLSHEWQTILFVKLCPLNLEQIVSISQCHNASETHFSLPC